MYTPVALLIFNRPDSTREVLRRLAAVRPKVLFVIADGPRATHPKDRAQCAAARALVDEIEWECEVVKQYSELNLGCGRRPATGIDWVFEQVDRAIILEDDCVPHSTFFRFCGELLEKYCDDTRVMQISGNAFHMGRFSTQASYCFTNQNPTWGWATWKRAWQHYDIAAKIWERFRNTSWVQGIVEDPMAAQYWTDMFEAAYRSGGEIDFWDYQWTLACWAQNGLSITPCSNLVSNIGFGREATHTFVKEGDIRADMQVSPMIFPLRHPEVVRVDRLADRAIIEETVLPNLLLHDDYCSWIGKQWASLVRERPSLKNPRALLRRLGMVK